MANPSHQILDTKTGKEYRAKAAAGRDLAYLVGGDPKDQFVFFEIARSFPDRFRVLNSQGEWVRLHDPSAPVGTLRPSKESPAGRRGGTRLTTVLIDERKYTEVRALLGASTLRETVDRSFDEVLVRAARAKDIARLRTMDGLDLDKASVMEKAWR